MFQWKVIGSYGFEIVNLNLTLTHIRYGEYLNCYGQFSLTFAECIEWI